MYVTIDEVLDFLKSRRNLGIKPGLERVEAMLDYVNHPEKQLPVVHLAGTNGKGSTLTFIKEALIQNGYTVGTFTSPSINKINDHIQINDESIANSKFVHLVNRLLPIINKLDQEDNPPTEYEILIIIALLYLEEKVDIALIETCMGGREDVTNCVIPIVTIITNIGLDHVRFLGGTYREIAFQKAGIIKAEVSVIIGEMNQESLSVIEMEAKQKHAPLIQYNKDFTVTDHRLTNENLDSFVFSSGTMEIPLTLTMKGKHQVHNASLACIALLKLKEQGYYIAIDSIQKGFYKAFIPGRFEKICDNPVVIIDGAHNKEGMATFLDAVNRYYPLENKQLLFAAFKDKPLQDMITQMEDKFDQLIFTSFQHERAVDAESLLNMVSVKSKKVEHSWKELISSYLRVNEENSVLFITGSLDFIGKVRNYFQDLKE